MKKMMLNAAVATGESFLGKYLPGFAMLWQSLRRYFHVDNMYVRTKVGRILFPFRHQHWERLEVGGGEGSAAVMAPPTTDSNAPDLYIPCMSFMTFVLIVAFVKGNIGQFTPDVLYDVATSCMVTQVLELFVIKLLLYVMGHARVSASLGIFDIVSFTGYKYVGLCINMLAAMTLARFFGWWFYYVCMLYTGLCMGVFIVKTLKAASIRDRSPKTTILLAAVALLQVICMWWLAYTGDINHEVGVAGAASGDVATATLQQVGGAGGAAASST